MGRPGPRPGMLSSGVAHSANNSTTNRDQGYGEVEDLHLITDNYTGEPNGEGCPCCTHAYTAVSQVCISRVSSRRPIEVTLDLCRWILGVAINNN